MAGIFKPNSGPGQLLNSVATTGTSSQPAPAPSTSASTSARINEPAAIAATQRESDRRRKKRTVELMLGGDTETLGGE